MKYRMFRLCLFLICLFVVALVIFNYDPGADVRAADRTTVELSEYEASYQWAKLTGELSSLRLVKEVGFRYHLAGDLLYEVKYVHFETLTNPFVAFFPLDLSGDKEYIAEAYFINTLGQTIYSDPVRIKRTIVPDCSTVVDRVLDTSVHVNLTINPVDNLLSEVRYALYQDLQHRRKAILGTDIMDSTTYSFDITGLTPDSEYIFRPSYVLPDGTEIKWESITWKTLKTSQVSPTPAPTLTPTLTPVPTPAPSSLPATTPTHAPTSALTSTSAFIPTSAIAPTSALTPTTATAPTSAGNSYDSGSHRRNDSSDNTWNNKPGDKSGKRNNTCCYADNRGHPCS